MKKSTHSVLNTCAAILLLIIIFGHETSNARAQTGTLVPNIPTNFTFRVDLRQGMTLDPDIKFLQTLLNSNPATVVATSGPGSLYQPTSSFGSLTKDAVSRFQNLYKAEVLTAAGLSAPTGSVGPFTRAKLNALIRPPTTLTGSGTNYIYSTSQQPNNVPGSVYYGYNSTTGTTGTTTIPSTIIDGRGLTKIINTSSMHYSTENAGARMYSLPSYALLGNQSSSSTRPKISITNFSTYQAIPLQYMSIFGSGFDQVSNNLFIGPVLIGNYKASNRSGSQITFSVPDYMPRGFYQIAVSNVFGTTTSQNQYLIIDRASTTESITRPIVNSVTPSETKNINDVITVNGSNFTLNNTVMTNLGNVYSIPSYDTRTLTFLSGSLPSYGQAQTQYANKSINLVTKVSNENGVSTEVVNHTMTFSGKKATVNTEPQRNTSTAETARLAETQAFIDARDAASRQQATSTATTTTASTRTTTQQPWNGGLNLQMGGGASGGSSGSSGTSGGNGGGTNNSGGSSNSNIGTALGVGVGAVAVGSLLGGGGGEAASGATGMSTYFGGTILQSTYCSCSGGSSLLMIDDYATNQTLNIMYQPGVSKLNMNFNVYSAGPYVVGGYMSGGGSCMIYAGTTCSSAGTAQYTIDATRGIGTSAY